MLKVYILDDEQHAIDGLLAMLKKKFIDSVAVAGSNCRVLIAIEEIEELQPDVLFLDVEMPELNGLEVLKHFPDRKFQIVFTTAYEKYALPAIKEEVTDYLVKPLSPKDVYDAIQKCIQRKTQFHPMVPTKQRISLQSLGEIIVVDTNDIIKVDSDNNYSTFYFTNRPKVMMSKTLKEYDELLTPMGFFRCHQSHLINMTHVKSLQNQEGEVILLSNELQALLSRRKKGEFLALLKS